MPTTVPPPIVRTDVPRPGTRAGYTVAAVVNIVLVWVVHNLLDWGWPPFLTDDFEKLLPLVTVSLVATAVVNLAYLAYDPGWFTSMTQLGMNAVALAVTIRTWQVFPFDFSAYEFAWDTVARVVLVVAMVAIAIAIVVDVVKLATGSADTRRRGRSRSA